jgi:hypothetical protein
VVVPTRPGRFRLLEPVRQHATARLDARGARDDCLDRLAIHLEQRARALGRRLYTDQSARAAFQDETGNVEQVLTWLFEQGFDCRAVRLAGAFGDYWFTEDQATGLRWMTRVEERLDRCDDRATAPARVVLGMLRQGSGESCALPQLTRALASFEESGRLAGAATAAFWLARELGIDEARPEPTTRAAVERALDLAIRAHMPILVSWSMIWLGIMAQRRDDAAAAERHYREALDVAVTADLTHPIGEVLSNLSELAQGRGDGGQARQLADRAVAACRRVGDAWQLLGTLRARGWICLWNGDVTQAALDVTETAELAVRVGDEYRVAQTLAFAADVLVALGEHDAALAAVRSLARWLLTHRVNPSDPVATTVARHESSSRAELPDTVADPIRVRLKAALDVLSTTGERRTSMSRES